MAARPRELRIARRGVLACGQRKRLKQSDEAEEPRSGRAIFLPDVHKEGKGARGKHAADGLSVCAS